MSRYSAEGSAGPQAAAGRQLTHISPPSGLFGANGMRFGPDGRLYVVQAFGSQVSAITPSTGACETISPVGGPIVAPDDIAFDSHGVMYVTEVMSARVSARTPNGQTRVIADNVPGANGITAYQDRLFMDECRPGGRLFELYPDGRAPRMLADNLPLPNALSVGPDGQLYFPEIAAGEIWRVPLSGGTPQRFLAGLAVPTAVKFDTKGLLTTTQAGSGEIVKFDIQSGAKTVVSKVRPGIDNLAIDVDNRLFISHFVDGGVAEILSNGQERVLVPAGFLGPFGLAIGSDGGLYAADGMSLVAVAADGRRHRPGTWLDEGFPGFVRGLAAGPGGGLYVTTSAGGVASYHPGTRAANVLASGLNELLGIARSTDGAAIVAEAGTGRVLKVSPTGTVSTVAQGLSRPAGVAAAADGSCYVSEAGRGRVVKLNGGTTGVVEGLQTPHGVALVGDQLLILDVGSKELISFSLTTKQRQTLASNLPVGAPLGVTPKPLMGVPDLIPGPLSPFAGLAAGSDGTIYLAGDGEGSILALKKV
jgi:sugar lactone lactonase YvrE